MQRDDYPQTVLEILDDDVVFKPVALRAVRAFAETGPWRGSLDERKEKFSKLNEELSEAYGIEIPRLRFGLLDGGPSEASHYIPALHQITLQGKLSVVTFLHEFAHARGMGERDACRWSVNLFRRCFPRQFGKLVSRGHMLISPRKLRRREARTAK